MRVSVCHAYGAVLSHCNPLVLHRGRLHVAPWAGVHAAAACIQQACPGCLAHTCTGALLVTQQSGCSLPGAPVLHGGGARCSEAAFSPFWVFAWHALLSRAIVGLCSPGCTLVPLGARVGHFLLQLPARQGFRCTRMHAAAAWRTGHGLLHFPQGLSLTAHCLLGVLVRQLVLGRTGCATHTHTHLVCPGLDQLSARSWGNQGRVSTQAVCSCRPWSCLAHACKVTRCCARAACVWFAA